MPVVPSLVSTPLSVFGATFLLGPGATRRYFEIDGMYEIPMDEDDPSFVLGGKHPGDESPDLVLETAAPLAARQAEFFRGGDDLYIRDLASEPASWIRHEREWSRLSDGQPRRLSPGDRLILGADASVASAEEIAKRNEDGALWVHFGDGSTSFRLTSDPNRYPYLSSYERSDPLFKRSPERLYEPNGSFRGYRKPYRLPFEERFWLWRSWGLTRMERLLDLSTRFRHELPDGTRRGLLSEAIAIGERLGSPLPLAKASLYAGDYWWEKNSFDLAEQYFERGRSLLETARSSHKEAARLWTSLSVCLYNTHASALWWARSRSRSAEAARHYEGMAKHVVCLRPPDPDDDSIDSVPLTRREYLERAATAYQTAGPEFSGDLGRVRRQIQAEFGDDPFR